MNGKVFRPSRPSARTRPDIVPIDIQIESDVLPVVPPGPGNPLGVRALYLGDTLYRIHGTHRPASISPAVSHGCFRMFNQHIVELYNKVQIGANVYVVP
jgi:lipoprotein-anchoring transpeptidase ErfK/SrfK